MFSRGLVLPALLWSVPLAAQVPDTVPATVPDTLEADSAAAPAAAPTYIAPRMAFSITIGSLGFGTLQSQPVLVGRIRPEAGAPLDAGPFHPAKEVSETALLRRRLETGSGVQLRASALLSLDEAWAVRVGVGAGETAIGSVYEGEESLFVTTARVLADGEATELTALSVEGALRMRVPSARRVQPYLELGASLLHLRSDGEIPGAAALADGVNRLAGLAAVGAVVPISGGWSARGQLTARAFRTPVDPAPAGARGGRTRTLVTAFEQPGAALFADSAHELGTALRLELGLSFGLGSAVPPPPPTAGPDAPSPSPGR